VTAVTSSADLYLTTKQIQLISVVGQRNDDGSAIDLDELLERLPYQPSKQSVQFSLRALVKRGLLAKSEATELRRGRKRRLLELTEAGKTFLGSRARSHSATSFMVAADEDEGLEALEALKIG
jgi:DNA-binding PadR family transcriptional regulator